MKSASRAQVLTMFSGEREYGQCVASVQAQDHPSVDHRIFSHLSNREAHQALYRTIMRERDRFDVFVKLDADMVLAHESVLSGVCEAFRRTANLDHLVLGVADWFTSTDIIGLHAFSSRVNWEIGNDRVFVDPDPQFAGAKLVLPAPHPVIVHHSPDPSPFQAFQFGVHRGMKACQRGLRGEDRDPHAARIQWRYLEHLWGHFLSDGDVRLGLAVIGADLVFGGLAPETPGDRQDPTMLAAFEDVESMGAEEILRRVNPNWSSRRLRFERWTSAMGEPMFRLVAFKACRDAFTWPYRILRSLFQRRLAAGSVSCFQPPTRGAGG
jgi:hypothetical protein